MPTGAVLIVLGMAGSAAGVLQQQFDFHEGSMTRRTETGQTDALANASNASSTVAMVLAPLSGLRARGRRRHDGHWSRQLEPASSIRQRPANPWSDQPKEHGDPPRDWFSAATPPTAASCGCHEVQPSIATIDRPARRLVATQQTLLIQPGIGAGTVQLVTAVNHGAQRLAALLRDPAHQLLERGEHVHTFGNQRHRRRPDVVIQTSHHDLHRSP